MPGTLWTIWLVRPCPMKPAPIKPTRIGFPCSSLAFNALSTMIMVGSRAHPALHLALDLFEVLPGGVLGRDDGDRERRSEEHTSELQSQSNLVCRLLLEKKKYR